MKNYNLKDWFLACNSFNTPTAKILSNLIGIGYGSNPKKSRRKVIRWGYSGELEKINNLITHSLPSSDSIKNCANKLKTLEILKNSKVKIPQFFTSVDQIRDKKLKFPMYCRKKFHTMGRDIILINNIDEALNSFRDGRYLVEGIVCKKEYRVHVFCNEIISVSKKYFGEELWNELGKPKTKDTIRNNSNGWRYYDVKDLNNVPKDVIEEAKKAVIALGLLWGAVDIIRSNDKVSYVLEVNSAPGLREGRAEIYANSFKKLIEKINKGENV